MRPHVAHLCIAVLAAIGAWQLTSAAYIHAKAWLAQELIANSWASTLEDQQPARPWPWADTWPIARLRIAATDTDLFVLADASGRSLAFGPSHVGYSALPGASHGNTIIAAHRDTHFAFLKDVKIGTEVRLQAVDGREFQYRIIDSQIIDSRIDQLDADVDQPMLTLVTCYPFDAVIPGGPLRYVVVAEKIADQSAARLSL